MNVRGKLSYANVVSTICLFLLLGGGAALAATALPKNSVGAKQLKKDAVNGAKVAAHSLTGSDLDLATLGAVPIATTAESANTAKTATTAANATHADTAGLAATASLAGDAETVNHFEVGCFAGTTLIRGVCFDLALNSAVAGVKAAATACAAKGGFLPTVMMLYSVRTIVNLGTGVAPDFAVADQYYGNTAGTNFRTLVVDGSGKVEELPVETSTKYICAYSPVG
jgi:hypothetical protein